MVVVVVVMVVVVVGKRFKREGMFSLCVCGGGGLCTKRGLTAV